MSDGEDSEQARFVREIFLSGVSAATSGVFSYATEAFRTVSLINGGSAAALLALISQTIQKPTTSIDVARLKAALLAFAVGLVCVGLSAALSYVSQYLYQTALYNTVFTEPTGL